ncbi:MAG: ABC transporter permease [bacterium]|nr:ABC transporter permease [bacterium]MCP4799063.1 ABC transporter permease [bacterium]
MRFSVYVAARYLKNRKHSRFLNRAVVTAIIGIALGVTVLNLTLAIMNGFHEELRNTFVDNMPMITVVTSNPEGFTDLATTIDDIGTVPTVSGVAPFFRQETIVTSKSTGGTARHRGAVIWGINPDLQEGVTPLLETVHPYSSAMEALRDGTGVVLGAELSGSLYAGLGDTVIFTVPTGELSFDSPTSVSKKYVISGWLDTGMYDFDSRFVFMSIDETRDLLGYGPDSAHAIGVRIEDMMAAPQIADQIAVKLGQFDHQCNDWISLNSNLFQWVVIEKIVMFLLLGLIILVAAFNIVGILTMMVGDRHKEIGIMLSIGATRKQIQTIFLLDGVVVGIVGVLVGTLFGWAGCMYLLHVGLKLPGDVYFVEQVPVIIQFSDFAIVGISALVMTLISTLLPSSEAARLKPIEIIRYT